MPRRNTRITEEEKNKALETYSKLGNLTAAAQIAHVSRETLYAEMRRSKAFKQSMERAYEEYCDKWELILEKRAQEPKADLLLMFKMKAMMPDKYREKIDHKVDSNIKIITGIPRPEVTSSGIQTEQLPAPVKSNAD